MTAILANLQVSSASKQYVRVPVTEITGADPTGDLVFFAFPASSGEPVTFYSGSWLMLDGIPNAQVLVGPGTAAVLPIGFYDTYVKISDNPETPVLFAGVIEVT